MHRQRCLKQHEDYGPPTHRTARAKEVFTIQCRQKTSYRYRSRAIARKSGNIKSPSNVCFRSANSQSVRDRHWPSTRVAAQRPPKVI
jgi:hypothetical protein